VKNDDREDVNWKKDFDRNISKRGSMDDARKDEQR